MGHEPNFTESVEHYSEYTRTVRRNVAKAGDLEPLTVIRFSLTEPVRKSLEDALKPYVARRVYPCIDRDTHRPDFQGLGDIVAAHMPVQIMEELQEYTQHTDWRTVYALENCPEKDEGVNIPQAYDVLGKEPLRMVGHSHVACIEFGLMEKLRLNKGKPPHAGMIERRHNEKTATGAQWHNHVNDIHLFGVMFSDKRLATSCN